MNENNKKRISKLMSLALRHNPDYLGISLNGEGWADTKGLLSALSEKGILIDMSLLIEIVETNDKKRFAFNETKTMIRANQGHSIDVNMNFVAQVPPEKLYHGTVAKFVDAIFDAGLQRMSRQYVHLSPDVETATVVGTRRGKPVIIIVNARKMHEEGFEFFRSENGVWLTDHVPASYLELKQS